jgi:glyoxylase I family protein
MSSVIGLGAIVIHSNDPGALAEWYRAQLGIETAFQPAERGWIGFLRNPANRRTVPFGILPAPTPLEAGARPVMVNYQVDDLDALLTSFRAAGVTLDELIENEQGRFAYVSDLDGNPVEVWQPPQDA